jgi:transcriptional regulator with XRE-family HTH domain
MLRAELKLSLREAAKRTGLAKETLSDLERGRRHPNDVTLAKIAEGYGISVGELFDLDEEQRSAEMAEEIDAQNKRAIRRAERLRKYLDLSRRFITFMQRDMGKNPRTALVESVAELADRMAESGIDTYMDLAPGESVSEEVALEQCEAAVKELMATTLRLIEAQEAREKDASKRGELRQLRHSLASRQVA